MIAEVQVLPHPPGTPDNPYQHVDAAIAAIEASGMPYEVGALGTTIEGDPIAIWSAVRRVHEECLSSGAEGVVTVIKLYQGATDAEEATVADLTGKFRQS